MLNELLLVLAVSIDTFMMSLACGTDCIKIPFKSALCVGVIGAIVMTVSVYCSELVCMVVPDDICNSICCAVLCSIGTMNITKSMLERSNRVKNLDYTNSATNDLPSVLDVFLCGSCVDCDHSKVVSVKEACIVSLLMSIDTLAGGIAGGSSLNVATVLILTLAIQTVTVWIGSIIGLKCSKVPNLSAIGGVLLILLGLSKLF